MTIAVCLASEPDLLTEQPAEAPQSSFSSQPATPSEATTIPVIAFAPAAHTTYWEYALGVTGWGVILVLTPWTLCLMPAVLGCFAKQCESKNYRPIPSLLALYCSFVICSGTLLLAFGFLFGPSQSHWIWNNPWAHVGMLIGYLALIGSLVGVLRLPLKGVAGDCCDSAILGFFLSVLTLPVTLPYLGVLLIPSSSFSSTVSLFAIMCGMAAVYCLVGLIPYPFAALKMGPTILRSIRIVSAMWLLGPFAFSIRDLVVTTFPPTRESPPQLAEPSELDEPSGPSRIDYGITYLLDVDDAIATATKQQRPLLLSFTGVNAINCRLMSKKMQEDHNRTRLVKFVRVQLFLDKIPRTDDSAMHKRLLARNLEVNESLLAEDVNVLPAHVIVSPDGKTVLAKHVGMELNEGEFAAFLDDGWQKWEAFQAEHSR